MENDLERSCVDVSMKKFSKIFIMICLISFFICIVTSCYSERFYTENIEDYNTPEYPLASPMFLEEIPTNAEVVSFSYFDYWRQYHEHYLELKFENVSDLLQYIELLKERPSEFYSDSEPPLGYGWFFETTNPYNPSYTELFCTKYQTWSNDDRFTGYTFKDEGEYSYYHSNYGIISYSVSDLIVIQTCSQGGHFSNDYIPKYFERFNVPMDETHERYFYFD